MIGYGMGPGSLAEKIGVEYHEAEEFIRDFYHVFNGVNVWKNEETYHLKRNGYVITMGGRRRTPILMVDAPRVNATKGTPEWNRQQKMLLLWQAEYDRECQRSKFDPQAVEENEKMARSIRQAINFTIQGSVAELINEGLVKLVYKGYEVNAQIHDEILVSIPDTPEDRERLKQFFAETFEREIAGVKFVAGVSFGASWAAK
jgi:DNA polymerase I-like protein with 3'-5' exonuclease and polymerase domains